MKSNEWEKVRLGEIADILSGYAFKSKDFVDSGVPIIKIKNIVPPTIDISDTQYVSENLYNEKKRYALKYNDILISMTGSNVNQLASAVGKIGRVRLKNTKLLLNQRVGKLYITNENRCNHDYLYYYLIQQDVRYNLAASADGSANQANISPSQIKSIEINLPPLEEQKAIANILSTIDNKIEVNNQINKTLEEMAQTIFKRWFVDFDFPNEDGEPYKSSGGEMIESELGMIPKGWETKEISTLFNVKDGTHDSPKATDKGYPLITSKHLMDTKIDFQSANIISEDDYNAVNKRSKVDRYDILISMIGTVGNLYLVQNEEIKFAIKNIGLFKTSEVLELYEYIYCYLKTPSTKQYINERMAGSTQQYISLGELRKIPIILPKGSNVNLISEFKEIINPIFNKIYVNSKVNEELVKVRDTLLPQLMSGEIRVPLDNTEEVQSNLELENLV